MRYDRVATPNRQHSHRFVAHGFILVVGRGHHSLKRIGRSYPSQRPQQDDSRRSIGVTQPFNDRARAGLAGIAVEAGMVLILEREATIAAAEEAGLFIEAMDL
jgi:hypothetical protein